ncbi:hypothetical protein BDA99DRAFT_554040 [Phascolomyces articulosus]|uniref:Uncharacterized protein n=1 Tax=Phascolomyces articulosus TaxID=60185 RepID=A0AAD5KYR5_9FUNG|nr:hypothetical protein BDA99DRAFT_554040 [Phascolomyces articulosus]
MDIDRRQAAFITALANSYHAQLTLYSACIVALIIRAVCVKQCQPYFLAGIALLAYFFQALLLNIGDHNRPDPSFIFGGYFLGSITAPLLWLNVFVSIYSSATTKTSIRQQLLTKNLFFSLIAFVWTLVITIIAIAVTTRLQDMIFTSADGRYVTFTLLPGTINLFNSIMLVSYGLWVYVLLFLLQLYALHRSGTIRPFVRSLCLYALLLVPVNVGHSLDLFLSNMTSHPESQFLEQLMATFVLTLFVGIFAIVVIIAFGHHWHKSSANHLDNNDTKKSIGRR